MNISAFCSCPALLDPHLPPLLPVLPFITLPPLFLTVSHPCHLLLFPSKWKCFVCRKPVSCPNFEVLQTEHVQIMFDECINGQMNKLHRMSKYVTIVFLFTVKSYFIHIMVFFQPISGAFTCTNSHPFAFTWSYWSRQKRSHCPSPHPSPGHWNTS